MGENAVSGSNWTEGEIDLIVADYFDMLAETAAGRTVNKAERNRSLQHVTGRSRSSIEWKHQNISAVLEELGTRWLDGYRPAHNYQAALIDGVGRYLELKPSLVGAATLSAPLPAAQAAEAARLYIGPAPAFAKSEATISAQTSLRRLVRKFDPAARDERNRELGERGEALVYEAEQVRLREQDREDLSRKVRWVSKEDGDGAGFDIRSYNPDGSERLIEVKTTNGTSRTPFYISENERAFSEERQDAFRLLRLYDFSRVPQAFELAPPLESALALRPVNWRASFTG